MERLQNTPAQPLHMSICFEEISGGVFRNLAGNRNGALPRALVYHQCGLGSILARCQMGVKFVVDYRLAPRL